ncbi:hypothetical protein [Aquimarina sp. 2201CG14-23]|uniref:hypothetical protein n=1 Tax=Aquimarina mycalae TaxID=3040073 RepID=UPI0024780137|nr:hypothetical protein [Aquimarina sp. 2201CG14-23]MDH7446730.1 hypothetical protein [Aquimarina sp. 2201CG14-23]
MKIFKITFLLLITVFSSCKKDVEILSAIKETIIPGIPESKPYVRYVVDLELLNDHNVEIEKIEFLQNKVSDFSIVDSKNNTDISKIEKKGMYKLIVTPNMENNESSDIKDTLVIFYKFDDQNKKITLNSFTEKVTRRR